MKKQIYKETIFHFETFEEIRKVLESIDLYIDLQNDSESAIIVKPFKEWVEELSLDEEEVDLYDEGNENELYYQLLEDYNYGENQIACLKMENSINSIIGKKREFLRTEEDSNDD